ncbi:MAG: ABC transporter ATP-binding protein [Myxococcales bacterium]|nr:ABC transporter ATP-binding protein [Myxococcales bacterium]
MLALRGERLDKTYGAGDNRVVALSDVTLGVEAGEVAALLGPSGSGKSTLLTTLGLLQLPDRGSVWLAGREVVVGGRALADLSALRRSQIGFVFQKANLVPFLSALENVMVAFEINGQRGRVARRHALDLLGYLGLADRADHRPDELSGGQQQRVAIARALAMSPPLVLADEPTAALDGARSRDVMLLFRRIAHERGTAVVVVTHDHRVLDAFDTVHEMEDGVLAPPRAQGRPLTTPAHLPPP